MSTLAVPLTTLDGFEFVTAEWCTAALCKELNGSRVSRVTMSRLGEGSGLASRIACVRVVHQNSKADDSNETEFTFVVKVSENTGSVSDFTGDTSQTTREAEFYRHVSDSLAGFVHVPPVYNVELGEGGVWARISMAMMAEPWRVGAQVTGVTDGEAKAAVKTLARLHARFWGLGTTGADHVPTNLHLPSSIQPTTTMLCGYIPMLQACAGKCTDADLESRLAECAMTQQDFGEVTSPTFAKLGAALLRKIANDGVYASVAQRLSDLLPPTIVHMDARAANMLFKAATCTARDAAAAGSQEETEVDICLYDWQNVCTGSAVMDLAYFLTNSLTVQQRRDTWRSLLAEYAHELNASLDARGLATVTVETLSSAYERAVTWPLLWACRYLALALGGRDSVHRC